jgi:hypothetical protein
MIKAMCNAQKPGYPTNCMFDAYVVFTQATPTDPALPRTTNALGIAGTNAVASINEAIQRTLTFFDTGFNTAKIVMLDASSFDDFNKHFSGDLIGADDAIGVEFSSLANGWSSRAGLRPSQLRHSTTTLNEKLRRSYRLV